MKVRLADCADRVAFCDPSGGKSEIKKAQARSAIVVLTQDWLERIFVLWAWAARCSTDRLIEKLFWVNEMFAPKTFGVEANAMQSLFADAVRREARQTLRRMPLQKVMQPPQLQKPFRNRAAIQPVLNEGRLFCPKIEQNGSRFQDLRHELGTHPMNPICDIVDALASAIKLLPKRAHASVVKEDDLAYARYLRRTGVHPDELLKLLAERERNSALRRMGGVVEGQRMHLLG